MRFHFRRYQCDRNGNVAISFALVVSVLLLIVGIAIDYARGVLAHRQLQHATDTAAMAVATRKLPMASSKIVAQAMLSTNAKFTPTITQLEIPNADSTFTTRLGTHYSLPTTLLQMFGRPTIEVEAFAEVTLRPRKTHVAMVLDNSGSMDAGNRMSSLISAAKLVVTTVGQSDGDVEFALVPFANFVNVGAQYKTANWINDAAPSPHLKAATRKDGTQSSTKRFELFAALKSEWTGCVEARASGLDVTDAPPTSDDSTKFVPLFQPDDPGPLPLLPPRYFQPAYNSYNAFVNHYVDDDGDCKISSTSLDVATKQDRTCKYYTKSVNSAVRSSYNVTNPMGPNLLCSTLPLTRLTSNATVVKAAIDAMRPSGGTNIAEGVAWGFRVLSKNAPFADGMTDAEVNAGGRRVMIVMTDGMNELLGINNLNGSPYSAYGFKNDTPARITGLGTGTNAENIGAASIDAKMLAACKNARDAGIQIYTIGLDIPAASQKAMQDCASKPQNAFIAASGSELQKAFAAIANDIASPYFSQ